MGIRYVEGTKDGTGRGATMYCSVTNKAFGPVFRSVEEIQSFERFAAERGVHDLRMLEGTQRMDELHEEWSGADIPGGARPIRWAGTSTKEMRWTREGTCT